jgi:hypothetical protein
MLYLISSLLFPDDEERRSISDWQTYFFENHRRIFLLLAIMFPLDLIDTLLKGVAHFRAQGPFYLITMIAWARLSLVAALTSRRSFHAILAVLFLIYNLFFVGLTVLTDQGLIGGTSQ